MITVTDALVICAAATGAALLGTVGGRLLLRSAPPRRSLRIAVTVVVLTPVAVMTVGVAAAGALMVVDDHTLAVLFAVIVAGTLAAAAVAAVLVAQVSRSSALLGEAARRLGDGRAPGDALPVATRELAAVSSELAESHRRLTEAKEREQAAEASRRELVAWISHDLRAPLAGVQAMVEALEDGVVTGADDVRDYHRRIRVQTDRLARMVGDLFDLSRINARSLTLAREPVVLADVVREVAGASESLARTRSVALTTRCDAGAVADADRRQVTRVLANLVTNAVRHTMPGRRVEVTCDADASGARLVVRDGCGGIPERELARLFEAGYRGQAARTPGDEVGAGLGLAIVRGIVAAHGGSITVHNRGDGCEFVVALPTAAVRSASQTPV